MHKKQKQYSVNIANHLIDNNLLLTNYEFDFMMIL